jgi:hypothetical protein
VQGTAGQTPGAAIIAWAGALTGSIERGFPLALGGQGAFAPVTPAYRIVALMIPVLLGAAAIVFARAGRRFQAGLAAIVLAATIVALWSVSADCGRARVLRRRRGVPVEPR